MKDTTVHLSLLHYVSLSFNSHLRDLPSRPNSIVSLNSENCVWSLLAVSRKLLPCTTVQAPVCLACCHLHLPSVPLNFSVLYTLKPRWGFLRQNSNTSVTYLKPSSDFSLSSELLHKEFKARV